MWPTWHLVCSAACSVGVAAGHLCLDAGLAYLHVAVRDLVHGLPCILECCKAHECIPLRAAPHQHDADDGADPLAVLPNLLLACVTWQTRDEEGRDDFVAVFCDGPAAPGAPRVLRPAAAARLLAAAAAAARPLVAT